MNRLSPVVPWPDTRFKRHVSLLVWLCLLLAANLLAACSSTPDLDEPPDIRYGEDTCERCLMIINEARYAAAYVTADGQTYRFDDIGGMLAHHRDMAQDVAVFWVHDYDSEEWLRADSASYVSSDQLHTPMGFGIIAFGDQQRAETWAAEHGGKMMTFADLLADDTFADGALEGGHDHE